jgi:hypothetical protein
MHFNQPRDRKNPEFHLHVEPVRSLPQLTLGWRLHQPWSKDETQRPFLDDVIICRKPSILWLRVKTMISDSTHLISCACQGRDVHAKKFYIGSDPELPCCHPEIDIT